MCKAPVKSSPLTNQHPTYYRLDALPDAQLTVSKHRRNNSTHPGKFYIHPHPFSHQFIPILSRASKNFSHPHTITAAPDVNRHLMNIASLVITAYWSWCSTFQCHGNGYWKQFLTDSFCRWRRSNSSITVNCVLVSVGISHDFFHLCINPTTPAYIHAGTM